MKIIDLPKKTFKFFSRNTLRYILKFMSVILALPSIILVPVFIEGLYKSENSPIYINLKQYFLRALFLIIIIELLNRYFNRYVEKNPMKFKGILYGLYYAKLFIILAISLFIYKQGLDRVYIWMVGIAISYFFSGICRAYSK